MNTAINLKYLIAEAIKDLPQVYLHEVADFALFIKQKAREQQADPTNAIRHELAAMTTHEQQHLEAEFADFAQQFPKE
jgi:uncharacterized protein YecA (UPF0149 family)